MGEFYWLIGLGNRISSTWDWKVILIGENAQKKELWLRLLQQEEILRALKENCDSQSKYSKIIFLWSTSACAHIYLSGETHF